MSVDTFEKKLDLFYEEFASLLGIQRDSISKDSVLSEIEWDSMALISTMALIDEVFGIVVSGDQLTECITIADILMLIKDQI
tara:strand:+ start:1041 stop:1286 length:246 start_codon:yes stop_codon:yes gene_type:complete